MLHSSAESSQGIPTIITTNITKRFPENENARKDNKFQPWSKDDQGFISLELKTMTHNPYHQNPAELAPIVGGTIRRAGVSREGFPYLVVENHNKTFYLFVQSDAEGNGVGYLSITESAGVRA